MRILLVIAMILMAGCASKFVPTTDRVISIDMAKPQHQKCECPPVPVCEVEQRGMKWRKM